MINLKIFISFETGTNIATMKFKKLVKSC